MGASGVSPSGALAAPVPAFPRKGKEQDHDAAISIGRHPRRGPHGPAAGGHARAGRLQGRCSSKQAVPDAEGAAARVAAAMLAPLAESAVAPVSVVRMGQHALSRWPELLAPLAQPVFFQREGTLVLWHRQDAAEATRLARVLANTGAQVPELAPMQTLDARGHRRAGALAGPALCAGLFLPGEGQLDNRALLASLLATLAGRPARHAALAIAARAGRLLAGHAGAARLGDRLPRPRRQAPMERAARRARRSHSRARARGEPAAPHPPRASALPALHRAQARQPVRDRRDRDRVGRHVARQRALHARTAERGLRRAQRFCRSAHRGDRHAMPPHAARQPARHSPAAAARAADQRPVPPRFHDRARHARRGDGAAHARPLRARAAASAWRHSDT
jgi:hypothetical protein